MSRLISDWLTSNSAPDISIIVDLLNFYVINMIPFV